MVWIADILRNALRLLANLLARLPGPPFDYVIVELAWSSPERTSPRPPLVQRLISRPWQRPEESLEDLRARLERIARSDRVRGIVLRIRDLHTVPGRLGGLPSPPGALLQIRRRRK